MEISDQNINFKDYPIIDDVKDIEPGSRVPELDAHWILVDDNLKLWRFVYQLPEKEPLNEKDRFHPILLIHGYRSSHVTWNYMVQRLWQSGFRNIFGMELFDYKIGLDKNSQHLDDVINEIFDLVSGYSTIDLIGHSMGGIVARYFAKTFNDRDKIRFVATLGAAHTGLSGSFSFLMRFLDRAKKTSRDLSSRKDGVLAKTNTTFTQEDQRITMLNIGGSLRRYRGTDGFVKPAPLTDMINMVVRSKHSNLNKQDKTSAMILSILLRKAWILKINFLSLEISEKLSKPTRVFFQLSIYAKNRKQTFPISNERIDLDPDNPLVEPDVPVIIFSDFIPMTDRIVFTFKLYKSRRLKRKHLTTTRYIMAKGDSKNYSHTFFIEKKNYFTMKLESLLYFLPN